MSEVSRVPCLGSVGVGSSVSFSGWFSWKGKKRKRAGGDPNPAAGIQCHRHVEFGIKMLPKMLRQYAVDSSLSRTSQDGKNYVVPLGFP